MTETVYATDVQLSWEKSTPCIESGFKNDKVPHGAVAGDNGTFIITTPSTLNLRICLENEDVYTRDIMSLVKDVTGWKRLSPKRFKSLEDAFKNVDTFEFSDEGISKVISKCI